MAAKWLGVPPWALLEQPAFWTEWARSAQSAENGAARERQARQERQAKMRQSARR
jgi:hypothetical protein